MIDCAAMTDAALKHHCEWRTEVAIRDAAIAALSAEKVELAAKTDSLTAEKAALTEEVDALKRRLYGKKSEKMPRPEDDLRKRGLLLPPDPEKLKQKRADGRKWKEDLDVIDIVQPLPTELPTCEVCQTQPHRKLPAKVSYSVELVPSRVVRHRHVQPQLGCACGSCIVTAPPPPRVGEKVQYGPKLAASLIAAKCMDAVAIERYAKQLKRMGVPISANTLFDLFHGAARQLVRLYELLVGQVRTHDLVLADETRIEVLEKPKTRRAWMWVFLAGDLVVYVFSPSRSGQTPVDVLGASQGTLVVDAYTGYNQVTTPEGRERAGCMAHGRRGLFDVRKDVPDMQVGLDHILDVYKVEHKAKAAGIVGLPAHAELRRTESKAAMDSLHTWLVKQQAALLPASQAGKAVAYMLNQWQHLCVFLGNPKVPVDNNKSERGLRIVARGRDAFLFVGNDDCGKNLAMLMTLVHTAAACGKNPEHYLADVLVRILDHPVTRLDELLPQNWVPPTAASG